MRDAMRGGEQCSPEMSSSDRSIRVVMTERSDVAVHVGYLVPMPPSDLVEWPALYVTATTPRDMKRCIFRVATSCPRYDMTDQFEPPLFEASCPDRLNPEEQELIAQGLAELVFARHLRERKSTMSTDKMQ
jgi:hypothetical protein